MGYGNQARSKVKDSRSTFGRQVWPHGMGYPFPQGFAGSNPARSTKPDKHLYCPRSADWRISALIRRLNCCRVLRRVFVLWGWVGLWCLVPCLGLGLGWFFGLGCFLGSVRMRGRFLFSCTMLGVCWMGWDEDEEACWVVVFLWVWGLFGYSLFGVYVWCNRSGCKVVVAAVAPPAILIPFHFKKIEFLEAEVAYPNFASTSRPKSVISTS